jgi:23S rRNA pseudouridine2605 synthase
MSEEIRLQVYLSRSGVASRRASAEIIRNGRVRINGQAVTEPGHRVSQGDLVTVDGIAVAPEQDAIYLAINKPAKVICSADDPEGRTSVLDLVADSYPQRLFTVGRLDYMTTGLLILTNDGDFANALSHPRSGVIKKYRVEAKEPVPRDMLEQWKEGVRVRGVKYQLSDFVFEGRKTVLLSLSEGKNREIRNVFASRSINIRSLERVQYGGLSLGNIKPGRFRELSRAEIDALLQQAQNRGRRLVVGVRQKRTGSDSHHRRPCRNGEKHHCSPCRRAQRIALSQFRKRLSGHHLWSA